MSRTDPQTGTLYIVATPLGNLADISLRALEILRQADAVACEDTRHAKHFLNHYGIVSDRLALHAHNEQQAAGKLIELLRQGKNVALISDAGTPGISDPGARAVAAVRAAGLAVVPVPGANAAITALSVAGLREARFLFVGFLPARTAARRAEIAQLKDVAAALVIYEAPHRIEACIADLAELLEPEREIVIARELTKLFEQIVPMALGAAPAWLAADPDRRRGEFVLLISAPPSSVAGTDDEAERILGILLEELPVSQAARLAAVISGAPKNALYQRALELKAQANA